MNKKIINNAISAYFWLGALLLFPSKKENINHPFVKKHAKTALFIHILMMINYIIFISYTFLWGISIVWFYLNHVFASIIFLWLFWWLLYGAYKASIGDNFSIKEMSSMTKTDTIVQIKNSNLNEQWILTIILSLIPFIGFTLKGRFYNYKSPIIENNIKVNVISTLIICSFFSLWYENIWFLLLLFYLIFIWFYAILVIIKENIITFHLQIIPTFEDLSIYFFSLLKYLKNYFWNNTFISFEERIKQERQSYTLILEKDRIFLDSLRDEKLNKILAYIPYINIITLVDIYSKNRNHIINWLSITLLSLIFILIWKPNYQIFLIFLVFFGIWYTKKREYRFPFLFDIYTWFTYIFKTIFSSGKKAIDLQKEVKEVNFEIEPISHETKINSDNFKQK